jgi:hypothetical protein
MLDDVIAEILGHYHLHPKLTGQVLSALNVIDRVGVTIYESPMELFIRRNDLYVLGYIGAGRSFCIDEPPKPDINATNLGYAAAYMDLGWNRTSTPTIRVTEDDIGGALAAAAAGTKIGKSQYLYLAILMEATRFLDVSALIKEGTAFSKTRLDWQDQVNAGNARVRKASQTVSPHLA